jgi:hypothetical protein
MKSDDPSTGPRPEEPPKALEDEATIKDGMRVGIILSVVNVTVLGLLLLGIQCGVDFVVPDMVLYNHTGSEIEIHLGNEVTVVDKNSSGIVDQPVACSGWIRRCPRGYKPLRAGTVNKKWSYEVVYPPPDYKKRVNSSRSEYHYQVEADGTIYLLEPDSEFPMHKLPPQPAGFPMVPKSTWGERAIIMN